MPEVTVEPTGQGEITAAVEQALGDYFERAREEQGSLTAALPGRGLWRTLVEDIVAPVARTVYEAGAELFTAAPDADAVQDYVRRMVERLVDESTLIADIQEAFDQFGSEVLTLDWAGVDGDSQPWRSRADLIGSNEAQTASMQGATDAAPPEAVKVWNTRGDDRVRQTHRAANRQRAPLGEPFTVGGAPLLYPGDPRGPAQEVMNCRCTVDLQFGDDAAVAALASGALVGSVTVDTDLPFAPRDTPWDGDAARTAVREWATGEDGEVNEDRMARAFLWRTDGPPSDWKFPVATVRGGELELVWSGITAAAAAVQGARSEPDLPEDDLDRVRDAIERLYARAAEEFDDEAIVAPWERAESAAATIVAMLADLEDEVLAHVVLAHACDGWEARQAEGRADQISALTAAALDKAITAAGPAWVPEASWFRPPEQQGEPTGITVSPEGRVWGYLAQFERPDGSPNCHVGIEAAEGQCVQPPRGSRGYGYFHQKRTPLRLSDGSEVYAGLMTFKNGHQPNGPDQGGSYFNDPSAVVGAVVAGEDPTGVWVAGSLLPDVVADADKLTRVTLSNWSGEWLRIGRKMELVAFTGVNGPGFPNMTSGAEPYIASPASSAAQGVDLSAAFASMAAAGESMRQAATAAAAAIERAVAGAVASVASAVEPDCGCGSAAEVQGSGGAVEQDVPVDVPDGVDEHLWAAALSAAETVTAAAALPDGVPLPAALQQIAEHLAGRGTQTPQARAAAVRAAQALCQSGEKQHMGIRMEACRLSAEYRARANAAKKGA